MLISYLILNQELDLKCPDELQQHRLTRQRNMRDMTQISTSFQFIRSLHLQRALCNNCCVRFDHSQSPSSSSNFRISLLLFSFSSIIYLISSKSYLINSNNFSMASSVFSLPFTLYLLALHINPRSSFSFISLFMYFITGMFTFMLLFTWDDI